MSLLGDDGRGFELAQKLESLGLWRAWLGESLYSSSSICQALSTPSSWDSFMKSDETKSRAQILLQLRVRALLFDKASLSLFISPTLSTSPACVAKLTPNYLQLHADDVYYTLEDIDHRTGSSSGASKNYSKSSFGSGSKYADYDSEIMHHRYRGNELPETWYTQFIEQTKVGNLYKLLLSDRDSDRRLPEEMSSYLEVVMRHKRRRTAFKGNSAIDGPSNMHSLSAMDKHATVNNENNFFPETMFLSNTIPDSAVSSISRAQDVEKIEFRTVLDTIPPVKNQVVIERLGISAECLSRRKNFSGGGKTTLSQEQALRMSQKVVARLLAKVGFEGSTQVPLEVFSQFMLCHFSKLGRMLKVLSDSYRSQCSATELIKMFLQAAGYTNLGSFVEIVKDGNRATTQPSPQQLYELQSQQQASNLRMQQIQRQLHPQMQQMAHSQSLVFQQQQQQVQLEKIRRRQVAVTPRSGIEVDKERPLVQVKVENPDLPMDNNSFNLHSRHAQMQQLRQMSTVPTNQSRSLASSLMPQMQTPSLKADGFQELMGGDASSKNDP